MGRFPHALSGSSFAPVLAVHPLGPLHCRPVPTQAYFKFDTTLSMRSINSLRVREIVSDTPSVNGHMGSLGLTSDPSRPKYFCRCTHNLSTSSGDNRRSRPRIFV